MKEYDERKNAPRFSSTSYFKRNANRPMVQLVNLDLNFAKLGTYMMIGRLLLSPFLSKREKENYGASIDVRQAGGKLGVIDDVFLKIRQLCQYSIHARPSHMSRNPDDIGSDTVHNLESAALGRRVYNFNAFIAPWLAAAKTFFPQTANPILGIPSRMIFSLDEIGGKITNMFWNIRRISMALIPYNGGISTEALSDKQTEVRDLVSYYTNKAILRPCKHLIELLTRKEFKSFDKQLEWQDKFDTSKVSNLVKTALESWLGNTKALFSSEYKDPLSVNEYKKVGAEEPGNHPLYVRSKILSQVLGLPAGLIGTASNGLSIGLNFVGNFFNNKSLLNSSKYLTNLANSLMAMVYLTGEVPANLNQYFKNKKQTGVADWKHLGVAGVGALGMINRIKHAPVIGSIMEAVKVKPVLDYFDKQLEKLFLMFFSANRWVLHDHERAQAEEIATAAELDQARKHENIFKLGILPFRVILGDKDVSYREDTGSFYRNLEAEERFRAA